MAKVQGICKNIDECSLAESREVQELERSEQFVCSECGKALVPPTGRPTTGGGNGDNERKKKIATIAAVAAVVLVALGTGSYFAKFPASLYGESVVEEEVALVVEEEVAEEEVVAPPKPKPITNGTINFSFGTYVGDLKNGAAEGQGRMTYKIRTKISKYDRENRYAEAGQSVVGTWYNNNLDFGKLYDAQGNLIETLTIGRAE